MDRSKQGGLCGFYRVNDGPDRRRYLRVDRCVDRWVCARGLLLSIIVGVIGAYLGGWLNSLLPFQIPLMSRLDIVVGTTRFNPLWAIAGSAVLLLLLNTLRGGQRRPIFSWRR